MQIVMHTMQTADMHAALIAIH